MIRLSDALLATQLDAALVAAIGGSVLLCSGERASTPNGPLPTIDRVVAQIGIDQTTFTRDGVLAKTGELRATARADGKLTHFWIVSSDRQALLDGSIGISSGDMRLNRIELLRGDTVVIRSFDLRFS